MKYLFMLIIFTLTFLCACTSENEARRVLEMDGVTNIQMTGYRWFSCSEKDFYHTGFSGERNGKQIHGVVCSGLIFKASTIRY